MTGLALILVLGIAAQWIAWRLRIPSILLLLLFGFLAGPVTHVLKPDELLGTLLLPLVSLFVALILFEGGMSLRIADLKQVGHTVRNLVTIGALVTGAIVTAAAHFTLGFDWALSTLLGSILLVTGPTVIGPLLRFVKPMGQAGPILRWEGIVIDPIGALVSVLVFEAIHGAGTRHAGMMLALEAAKTIGIGSAVGAAAALVMVVLLSRYWIPDYLQNPVTLALVAATFIASNRLQPESGLFTVTIMGILLANQTRAQVHHIAEFKETLSIVLISSLFIVLAARMQRSQLAGLAHAWWHGAAFLAVLVLIGRPLAVFASTFRSGLTWREKAFLSAVAPRGIVAAAVASVFALRLREANVPHADLLVPYTFVVIIGTVIIYGLTARTVAKWLGLTSGSANGCLIVGAHPLARAIGKALLDAGHPVLLVDTNRNAIQTARLAGLPTYFGTALSGAVHEKLDLTGVGRLLALTPNDEVNSLAALHFARVFGRSEVYQLSPESGGRHGEFSKALRGRALFGPGRTYAVLEGLLEAGATVKKTQLTAEFSAARYQEVHPEAVPLFLLGPTGELVVITGELKTDTRPGTTIVSLALPAPRPADAREPLVAPAV